MARKPETKYMKGGKPYYRKRKRMPDGLYHDVYGATLEERDRKVQELEKELTIAQAADEPGEKIFFYAYAGSWYRNASPAMSDQMRTVRARHINEVICPVIGGKVLTEITSDDVAAVMATVAGRSKSYQSKLSGTMKMIFRAAVDAGKISRDPTARLKAGGKKPQKKKALTEAQQKTLLEAVEGLSIEPFIMLGLYTGMRREEILGLLWGDVSLDEPPHVAVAHACKWPKNTQGTLSPELKRPASYRTIPIPRVLQDYLTALKAKETGREAQIRKRPVIHRDGGQLLSYAAFRSRWNAVKVRSTESGRELGTKVPKHKAVVSIDFKVTPHILRHTYITRLILGGVPLKRVQYLAGHDDAGTTLQIYTDLMGHAPEDLIGDVRGVFDS